MKYKGIELNEFESEKPVLFDPPKRMLMWNDGDDEAFEANVYAFIPKTNFPVIGSYYNFDHCAEIPDTGSELSTVIQVAEWASKGYGLMKRAGCITNYVSFSEDDEHSQVSDVTLVRKWGDKEWHKPTREYLGLEDK